MSISKAEFLSTLERFKIAQDNAYSSALNSFTGAAGLASGATGLVPAPQAGDNEKFLCGDGTWANVPESYTLPTASTTTKGGVVIGAGLSMVGDTLTLSTDNILNKLNDIEDKIDSLTVGNASKTEPTIHFLDNTTDNISLEPTFMDWGILAINDDAQTPFRCLPIRYIGDGIITASMEDCFVNVRSYEEDLTTWIVQIYFARMLGGEVSQPTTIYISASEGENYAAKTITVTFEP